MQFPKKNQSQSVQSTYKKMIIMILNTSNFLSPTYTLSLSGNIIVHTFSQGTTREKFFVYIIYKEKMPTQGRKKTIFHSFLPSLTASLPFLDREYTGLIRQKWTSKCLFPLTPVLVYTIKISTNRSSKRFSKNGK